MTSPSTITSTSHTMIWLPLTGVLLWAAPQAATADAPAGVYTLPEVIGLAIEHNPRRAGATGIVDEREGQRVLAGAYPNPRISAWAGRGSLRDGGLSAPGRFSEAPPNTVAEYNAQIFQPLEWPAKREARQHAASAGLESAVAGYDETLLNLRADVKLAFWSLLSAQRSLELARQNLEIIEGIRQVVDRRVELGEAPRFEAIKAEVEVLKAQQVVTRDENTVEVSRVVLDSLTAGSLGTQYTIDGEFERLPTDLDRDRLVQDSLRQHPTMRRLLKLVEESGRTVEFERHARVPNVTVQAAYWREYGREAVQGGLMLPVPVWYQRQGEIAAALGSMRREEANLLRTRFEFIREVNQHFKDASTTARLVEVFEQGMLRKTQAALRMARFSFKQGESSLLQVLDAQRVYREVMMDYIRARHNLSASTTQLERFVGGSLYVR